VNNIIALSHIPKGEIPAELTEEICGTTSPESHLRTLWRELCAFGGPIRIAKVANPESLTEGDTPCCIAFYRRAYYSLLEERPVIFADSNERGKIKRTWPNTNKNNPSERERWVC
jgi:hypothetical protein